MGENREHPHDRDDARDGGRGRDPDRVLQLLTHPRQAAVLLSVCTPLESQDSVGRKRRGNRTDTETGPGFM